MDTPHENERHLQPVLPVESEPETLDGFEQATEDQAEAYAERNIKPVNRLRTLYDRFHFLPVNRRELNEAFSLLSFHDQYGAQGTAKHLGEVHRRQEKLRDGQQLEAADDESILLVGQSVNPADAVRSIVTQYRFFERRSRYDIVQLESLQQSLGVPLRIDPELTMSQYMAYASIELGAGPAQLVRFADGQRIRSSGDLAVNGVDSLVARGRGNVDEYTRQDPSDEFLTRLLEKLDDVTAVSLRDGSAISDAITLLHNRERFWHDRLVEAYKHVTARPLVRAWLQEQDLLKADNETSETTHE